LVGALGSRSFEDLGTNSKPQRHCARLGDDRREGGAAAADNISGQEVVIGVIGCL
jgi:hypothetical protein